MIRTQVYFSQPPRQRKRSSEPYSCEMPPMYLRSRYNHLVIVNRLLVVKLRKICQIQKGDEFVPPNVGILVLDGYEVVPDHTYQRRNYWKVIIMSGDISLPENSQEMYCLAWMDSQGGWYSVGATISLSLNASSSVSWGHGPQILKERPVGEGRSWERVHAR